MENDTFFIKQEKQPVKDLVSEHETQLRDEGDALFVQSEESGKNTLLMNALLVGGAALATYLVVRYLLCSEDDRSEQSDDRANQKSATEASGASPSPSLMGESGVLSRVTKNFLTWGLGLLLVFVEQRFFGQQGPVQDNGGEVDARDSTTKSGIS